MEAPDDDDYYDYYDNYTDDDMSYLLTDEEECPGGTTSLQGSHIYLPIAYFLMFSVGFLGNLCVMAVVGARGKSGGSRRLVDTFVLNLASADLVFVLTLPLWAVSAGQKGRWDFGEELCKLSSYVVAVNRFSNIFFLVCMSVDRYLAVVRLMDSRFLRSGRCVRLTCAAVWAASLLLGVPSLVYRTVVKRSDDDDDDGVMCVDDQGSFFFLSMSLVTLMLTFVLPVLIIVLCYGTVLMRLRKHCSAAGNPRAEARRRHSLKMVLTIIAAFVVSWFPFNVFKTIVVGSRLSNDGAGGPSCTPSWQTDGVVLSSCLAFLNSCVNPAIYFFLNRHFRRRALSLGLAVCLRRGRRRRGSKGQSHSSTSASFTNTSDTFGTNAFRLRLQSGDHNI